LEVQLTSADEAYRHRGSAPTRYWRNQPGL